MSDRNPDVVEWVARQNSFELFLCIPVIAEIAFGARRILLEKQELQISRRTQGYDQRRVSRSDLAE